MRVMGVDPGLTRCGIAIVQEAPSRKVELLQVQVARTLP
ncbi:MAG: crossover junction endodeoxyribonuclease RuvC, partial [Candidatus Nanopelagicales bacterium]